MKLANRLLPVLLIAFASAAYPLDWSGNLAVEARIFPSTARWPEQKDGGLSLSFQPELRHRWHDGDKEDRKVRRRTQKTKKNEKVEEREK